MSSLCLPSALSDTLSQQLNNPLAISTLTSPSSVKCAPEIIFANGLPCGYHILNFRSLKTVTVVKEALVVIHHRGIDCNFPALDNCNHQVILYLDRYF